MAVTYAAAVKTARMNAVVAQIDEGTGAGKLKLYKADGTSLVAVFTLTDPCGTVAGSVLTFDADPDLTTTTTDAGTIALATITDSDDEVKISGLTVGTSGTDIVIDNNVVTSGQTVNLLTGTLTHA